MQIRCPGCLTRLSVDDDTYKEKVLIQCPDCLYVFMAKAGEEGAAGDDSQGEASEIAGEATLLTSDFKPSSDAREFQWNVPGASITIIEGDKQGVHRKLPEEGLVIGRQGADLIIVDKAISRRHCQLVRRDDGWYIEDLDSLNGTFVNGAKIKEARLNHLDEFRVGTTRMLFAEAGAPEDISVIEEDEDEESGLDRTRADSGSAEKTNPLPQGTEFYLEYMTGEKKARSIKLAKTRLVLGRGDEADIKIDDQGVSRKHGMIEIISRQQIYISDLASQNGIWLNGMRIRNTKLIHGDLVRLGNTVLKFIVQDMG